MAQGTPTFPPAPRVCAGANPIVLVPRVESCYHPTIMAWRGVIHQYKSFLPLEDERHIVTLNEGNTPLIRSGFLEQTLGASFEVYLKFEGLNPTGSFKDRGMTMAISKAHEAGAKAVICASTGNTAASAAAYAARAGMKSFVMIPKGNVALGKLAGALIYGAKVIQIAGNFDQALCFVREIAQAHPVALVNSVNPHRIEGQMTGAFEIVDELGKAPAFHALPVGNAGNISAYWKGYKAYQAAGRMTQLPNQLPVMLGFQAAGAAPIVHGHPVEHPETVATAIKIGNPASWKTAVAAREESGGLIDAVGDDEILAAYKLLASKDGVFCEPASAAGVAGVLKLHHQGFFEGKQGTLVCTLTGHGLKDSDNAIGNAERPVSVPAQLEEILEEMDL